MKAASIIFITLVLAVAQASIARVVIIPGDYPTIQEGIDSCTDGDTVLVKPGTYYENINFNGHNIVVASFFLTTGNPEYITNTVIDGESSGSVVTFENGEDTTAIIMGLTIQNGYSPYGGGIHCGTSNPTVRDNIINENIGPSGYFGGGIYCEYSTAIIENNIISNNHACWGGGIYSTDSNIRIYGNKIFSNSAFE
jgi:hypothetical protein